MQISCLWHIKTIQSIIKISNYHVIWICIVLFYRLSMSMPIINTSIILNHVYKKYLYNNRTRFCTHTTNDCCLTLYFIRGSAFIWVIGHLNKYISKLQSNPSTHIYHCIIGYCIIVICIIVSSIIKIFADVYKFQTVKKARQIQDQLKTI